TLGLRPTEDGATTLTDSLASLLQLSFAGRISQRWLGPSFHAWEQGMDLRGEALLSFFPKAQALSRPSPLPALAGEAGSIRPPEAMQMSAMDAKGASAAVESTALVTTNLYMILLNLSSALTQAQPRLSYDGELWQESRDAPAIAGRLRSVVPLPREKTLELF